MCGYCVRVCVVTGQVHAGVAQMDSSRHPFTVKGQGGASCGLGLDDVANVAVRDPGKRFALQGP